MTENWNESDYKRAKQWAQSVLQRQFLILDTETTGLDDNAEAVQIAILNNEGNIVFDSLVKPIGEISPEAISIHGIDKEKVKEAPLFAEVYPEIKAILEASKVLIYNASFDLRIINQQCHLNDLPSIKIDSECVMSWYSEFCGNWSEYHQSYTWQRLPGGDHSALGDCQATLRVLKKMAEGE